MYDPSMGLSASGTGGNFQYHTPNITISAGVGNAEHCQECDAYVGDLQRHGVWHDKQESLRDLCLMLMKAESQDKLRELLKDVMAEFDNEDE